MDTDDCPELLADTSVTEVFDASARAEFFDWLSGELGRDIPRFSFSIVATLGELFDLLVTICKEDFVAYCSKLKPGTSPVSSSSSSSATPAPVTASSSSIPASSPAPIVIPPNFLDDMPQLEPVKENRSGKSPVPASKSEVPPNEQKPNENLDFLRGDLD